MTTATAISGTETITRYAICTSVDDSLADHSFVLQQEPGFDWHFALDFVARAEVASLIQPGQRYKVTITRAEEDGDGDQD